MIALTARLVAAAIVVAAIVDPSLTLTVRDRATVSVIEDATTRVGDRLARDYRVVRGRDDGADATVVVGRSYPADTFPAAARIATVTLPSLAPSVRIANVDAPAAVPDETTIHLDATVVTSSPRPTQTTVVARINGTSVARAQHLWRGTNDRWHATLDVVPIGDAPWVIVVSAGESVANVVVDRAPRIAVTFFEPRPSWTTTFVRRALERDARFNVSAVTRLDTTGASTVVVGGLERLTDADAATLDRFARERGGAVVMLPDTRVAGASPTERLMRVRADEPDVLLDRAVPLAVTLPLPELAASEMLTFSSLERNADVLARAGDATRPVVWSARRGEGRVLVSGAMDAWRFRAERDQAFDRFWRAAIAGVALAAPPLVDVSVTPQVVRPLETVRVHARVHRSIATDAAVSATLGTGEVVRLWPDAELGEFTGTFVPPARDGASRIEVAADSGATHVSGTTSFAVAGSTVAPSTVAPGTLAPGTLAPDTLAPLSLLSASHAGVNVLPGDLTPLDRWLCATVTAPAARATRHPMRSPCWMLPLFGCLTLDWWITSSRRRRR